MTDRAKEAALLARVEMRDETLYWRRSGRAVRFYTCLEGYQRFCIKYDRRVYCYTAHRVVWFLHHRVWPAQQIDHINRDPSDNRIANLRDVSPAENNGNKRRWNNSKSGAGVCFDKRRQARPWGAFIQRCGTVHNLGRFSTKEEALEARLAAEEHFRAVLTGALA